MEDLHATYTIIKTEFKYFGRVVNFSFIQAAIIKKELLQKK